MMYAAVTIVMVVATLALLVAVSSYAMTDFYKIPEGRLLFLFVAGSFVVSALATIALIKPDLGDEIFPIAVLVFALKSMLIAFLFMFIQIRGRKNERSSD